MANEIAVRLPPRELAALDRAVSEGRFPSRAEAVRAALALLLGDEPGGEIEESYRRAYGEQPEEEWVGDVGLRLLAERVADNR